MGRRFEKDTTSTIINFCKLLLFFQNKARITDSSEVYSYMFLCMRTVYIVPLYVNITKNWNTLLSLQIDPDKPVTIS